MRPRNRSKNGEIKQGLPPIDAESPLPHERDTNMDIGSSTPAIRLLWIALIAFSVSGSCLAAPFLFPFFQLFLVPPILGAIFLGAVGGLTRKWWITGLVWCVLAAGYAGHDLANNKFGYASLYRTYVLGDPPEGFMYFHSWQQLFDITIIPLTLGVAAYTHMWAVERLRRRRFGGAVESDACWTDSTAATEASPNPSMNIQLPRGGA